MDVLEIFKERGFMEDCTDEEGLKALLAQGPVTAYIGFDPTASSLHAGSLVQIMSLAWLQRCGHNVVVIVGGGTARVGDPSGKTEMRRMLTVEELEANARGISAQLAHFVELDGVRGRMVDNALWLCGLNYIDFLRDIGRHFSVNRMLAAESYKIRLEKGLSFLEFNYQVLQAYDFLELYRRHGVRLQMGGSDQWGNIVAGIDLIRRMEAVEAYGLTTPLVTTASGEKMGKSASGAVWLDRERLSPYDYFQYWRNTQDADVGRFLRLFTFLPMDEIRALEALKDAAINQAKERLAWECTALLHGQEEADKALAGARAAFYGGGAVDDIPTLQVELPCPVVEILEKSGLCASRSDARRNIQGGAVRIHKDKVTDIRAMAERSHLGPDGSFLLWMGKKQVVRVLG